MATKIWAGTPLVELPSPISLKCSRELIWDEKTGRAQSGDNKGKMIGSVVARKRTYEIQWGILTGSQLGDITSNLSGSFFKFGVGQTKPADPDNYYRGNLTYDLLPVGDTTYYKNCTVTVIEQ